ncbi:hypothetical protein ABZZ36_28630 [Actinacidiphila glaucinigra]|uniref:hypothetical protein n=1 Tax=Actinacidiphila glaucinigra TaxID=235986 RepID=UPI0033B96959
MCTPTMWSANSSTWPMTALCAVAHLHRPEACQPDVVGLLAAHVDEVAARAGVTHDDSPPARPSR